MINTVYDDMSYNIKVMWIHHKTREIQFYVIIKPENPLNLEAWYCFIQQEMSNESLKQVIMFLKTVTDCIFFYIKIN
jgi:hypothetical protein